MMSLSRHSNRHFCTASKIAGTVLVGFSTFQASTAWAAQYCPILGGGDQKAYETYTPSSAQSVTVETYEELRKALKAGVKELFIPGDVSIELPNQPGALKLGKNQIIFSDRGNGTSKGALLFVNGDETSKHQYSIIQMDSGSAFIGLRFKGPTADRYTVQKTIGLQTLPQTKAERVLNSEIYNWPWAGVSVKASSGVVVEGNYIHDNHKRELGYGVVTQNGQATVTVSCNVFDGNRHSIAGQGNVGEGYDAVHNLVLNGGKKAAYHQFDMHKGTDQRGAAGAHVHIKENIFDFGRYGTESRRSVYIRSIPTQGPITVTGNVFTQGFVVGHQKAVDGVPGSVPSDATIQSDNAFNVKIVYDKTPVSPGGGCSLSYMGQKEAVNCAAITMAPY